jgi:hypothetical protein
MYFVFLLWFILQCCQYLGLYTSIEWYDDWWIINLNGFQKQSWPRRSRYHPSNCLEGLRKTIKISQDTWCPAQDLNQEPPKYKSTVLPLQKPVQLFCISYWVGSITFQFGHTQTRSDWKRFVNRIPYRSQYWNLWEQNKHTDGLQWALFTAKLTEAVKLKLNSVAWVRKRTIPTDCRTAACRRS